jgi:hypothetical protein
MAVSIRFIHELGQICFRPIFGEVFLVFVTS